MLIRPAAVRDAEAFVIDSGIGRIAAQLVEELHQLRWGIRSWCWRGLVHRCRCNDIMWIIGVLSVRLEGVPSPLAPKG